METYGLLATELVEKIKNKKISAEEITKSAYQRIGEVEEKTHSFITLTKDLSFSQAKEIDEKIRKKEPVGSLAGVPIAIKDNICLKGVRITCGSKILENFISPYDATVVRKLHRAGAIFIGKTNMDEFAMGSSTETSYFSPTRNPWNPNYVPGGSSGGSAAAVACGETVLAIGSDTGGSIRQPASFCGVVGLKPTYGRVSRFGLVAFASSLDQIGCFSRNVADTALLLNVIAGWDENDSTSVKLPVPDYTNALVNDVKNIKIGVPREYFVEGVDKDVEENVRAAIELLEHRGAKTSEISLPHTEYAIACYYILAPSEASANLARYDGVKYGYRTKEAQDLLEEYEKTRQEGFGPEVKRRIMLGTYALSAGYYNAYYLKAQKVRRLIKEDFDRAFEKVDVLITPTSPTPAFKIGEKLGDPLKMYLSDIFTISANLAGLPCISLPCGLSREGLPIGLQILAGPFEEEKILRIAHTYEQNTDWHKKNPKLLKTG